MKNEPVESVCCLLLGYLITGSNPPVALPVLVRVSGFVCTSTRAVIHSLVSPVWGGYHSACGVVAAFHISKDLANLERVRSPSQTNTPLPLDT